VPPDAADDTLPDDPRGAADPTCEALGGGVREGGGEGAALDVDPTDSPELEPPLELLDAPELEELDELDELDEPDDVEPRGTACALANPGTARATPTNQATA
jgi:hypothetical protein